MKRRLLMAVHVYQIGHELFTERESIHGQSVGIPLDTEHPSVEWAGPFPPSFFPRDPT